MHARKAILCSFLVSSFFGVTAPAQEPNVPPAQPVNVLLVGLFGWLRHGANVATGTEGPACPGNDDSANFSVCAPGAKRFDRAGQQFRIERIELVGTIKGKKTDSVLYFGVDHET